MAASGKKVEWVNGRILGKGANGVVTYGTLKDGASSIPVAIKSASGNKAKVLRREMEILNHLQGCSQILKCYGGMSSRDTAEAAEVSFNLFLEYAQDGSLLDYLESSPMNECDARRLTRSMLRGLAHIHLRNIVHCDIKPANVLLWDMKEVKIADFGNSMLQGQKNNLLPCRGTPYYIAPECLSRNEYGPASDVWALGCTLVEMLTSRPAMSYLDGIDNKNELLQLIASGKAMPKIPEEISEMGKDFLTRCFEANPSKRWTVEMLLQHPYVKDYDDTEGKSSNSSALQERVTQVCMPRCMEPKPTYLRRPAIPPGFEGSIRLRRR